MNERWRKLNANITQYVPFRASMGQHCSLSAVQRKTAFLEQSWWHLTCLDQCHSVCPHGTSSLQGWRKRVVVQQSEFDPWVYILVFAEGDCCRFAQEKLSHRSMPLWTSVFFCVCASNSQDSPKASPRKNFIEQLKLLLKWMLIERWGLSVQSSTCQHGPTLQFVSCAEKDSLCGTVMMAWIWHVWINAMVFVHMAQAPPKADAKELL